MYLTKSFHPKNPKRFSVLKQKENLDFQIKSLLLQIINYKCHSSIYTIYSKYTAMRNYEKEIFITSVTKL